jgi:hypothetical protein
MNIVWQAEDSLREKKVESDLKDLQKTLVAFANSVAPGDTAKIFIGEKDDGTVQGVKDTDSRRNLSRNLLSNRSLRTRRKAMRLHKHQAQRIGSALWRPCLGATRIDDGKRNRATLSTDGGTSAEQSSRVSEMGG